VTSSAPSVAQLVSRLREGDARAAGRLITLLENDGGGASEALSLLHPLGGRAHVIGVTGAPGTGKSTLVDKLVALARTQGRTVGVVAVDPSSPFTGGAVLGDRIRMQRIATDPGVFVRSLATRGALGGLSRATGDAVAVLDAMGKDMIFVETVGVGQDEVDVVKTADTVVLVTAPSLGDEIQAFKSGIMEIGDVFVVNKADLPGADQAAVEIESALSLAEEAHGASPRWRPPVLRTDASRGEGAKEVLSACGRHWAWLAEAGGLAQRRASKREAEILDLARERVAQWARSDPQARTLLAALAREVAQRRIDARNAASVLLSRFRE